MKINNRVHNDNHNGNASAEHFPSPKVLTRVGDVYQAEIPEYMTKSEYLQQISTTGKEIIASATHIPITRIYVEAESINDERKPNAEINEKESGCRNESVHSASIVVEQDVKIHLQQKNRRKCVRAVPGLKAESWTKSEEVGFLLGLYIYGKNLFQVKRFLQTKEMGDILSYYYGKFFGSKSYRRWSECRKIKSRKCIYGKKIFTGPRQQEVLSRLFPYVPADCQHALVEKSRSFGEGRMPLEEYVNALKAIVGLDILAEAVGIGKGEQDLTGIATEPLKSNQVISIGSQAPSAKSFSTLAAEEIVDFLTGNFYLSKAQLRDLFWEAIWPRLLARGWHSEQPNSLVSAAGARLSLVFLIPGIEKFSRRKLIKGDHYFDSISDVLQKVTSEPGLLVLENETDGSCRIKEENGWANDPKMDQEGSSNSNGQQHCNIKRGTSNQHTDDRKFQVIDTSMFRKGTLKLKELRNLPPTDIMRTSRRNSEDSNAATEEAGDGLDDVKSLFVIEDVTRTFLQKETIDNGGDSNGKEESLSMATDPGTAMLNTEVCEGQNTVKCNKMKPRVPVKSQVTWNANAENKNYGACVPKKRRRLNAGNCIQSGKTEIDYSLGSKLNETDETNTSSRSGTTTSTEIMISYVETVNRWESMTGSSSSDDMTTSVEGITKSSGLVSEYLQERPKPRKLFDLNLPPVPDADEHLMINMTEKQEEGQEAREKPDDCTTVKKSEFSELSSVRHNDKNAKNDEPRIMDMRLDDYTTNKLSYFLKLSSGVHPKMNARSQSLRNQPPTIKALQGVDFGLLSTKETQDNVDAFRLREPDCDRANFTDAESVDES